MPSWIDHILMFVITIAFPVYGFIKWKEYKRDVAAKKPNAKMKAYIETILLQWSLCGAVLLVWLWKARSFAVLGLDVIWNQRFILANLFVIAACAFLVWQWLQVRKLRGNIPDSLRNQLKSIAEILPDTSADRKLFMVLAVTAGICEEILYRGFLMWYVESYAGFIPAIVISILVFGLAHAYQGRAGILKTGAMGALLVGIYVVSGSLLGPIILHCVTDVTSGLIGSEARKT
jgi:uncharacterized protein